MGLNGVEDLVGLPLGPHEVVVAPVFEVAHGPPEASLQSRAHKNGVVAAPDVVLVRGEGRDGELDLVVVALVDPLQKLAVVLLLQFEVLLLVLRVA